MTNLNLLWVIFWTLVVAVSVVDLFVLSRKGGVISVPSALRWTALWVSLALAFGAVTYFLHPQGPEIAPLYITGYLTEYSLSVDNLFVFILIFAMMKVAPAHQPRLIKLGIYLSIFLRIIFIYCGIKLLEQFAWMLYVFGGVLIWTAWKMISAKEDDHVDPTKNILYRIASAVMPVYAGDSKGRMFTRHSGKWMITSLFLVFLVIGSTDVVFAIDSIPAIIGISRDPFVVTTSNVFAVLGLNALFFALNGIMNIFRFLKHGVSFILFFIGAKMLMSWHHDVEHFFKAHTWISLVIILVTLGGSIALSMLLPEKKDEDEVVGEKDVDLAKASGE